jgi:BirA family biotin operon repressor/biotin-[acetyl-CoA-carboxylase] ligase
MSEITLEILGTVDSTMDVARDFAREGRGEGTVVVAETQKRGRGRNSSTWISPPGGAWFSVLLKPSIKQEESHRVVFLAGLCVHEVLGEQLGIDSTLRWPNDILLEGRKLAGVLGEGLRTTDAYYAVVGVGVNTNLAVEVFSERLRQDVATTLEYLGHEVENGPLIRSISERLLRKSSSLSSDYPQLLEEWKSHCDTIGKTVEVDGIVAGRAISLDDEGFLILADEEGNERRIVSGNIRYAKTS